MFLCKYNSAFYFQELIKTLNEQYTRNYAAVKYSPVSTHTICEDVEHGIWFVCMGTWHKHSIHVHGLVR